MGSDNPTGADNQQETEIPLELDAPWVVGFVDGEGCFLSRSTPTPVHHTAGS
jgi:hypothetical protein